MRLGIFGTIVAVLAAIALSGLHAPADAEGARQRSAAAAALGIADLCLSSDARWLRHPSLSEPGAAFADLPGAPDAYPAGMVLAPPAEAYADSPGTTVRFRTR